MQEVRDTQAARAWIQVMQELRDTQAARAWIRIATCEEMMMGIQDTQAIKDTQGMKTDIQAAAVPDAGTTMDIHDTLQVMQEVRDTQAAQAWLRIATCEEMMMGRQEMEPAIQEMQTTVVDDTHDAVVDMQWMVVDAKPDAMGL